MAAFRLPSHWNPETYVDCLESERYARGRASRCQTIPLTPPSYGRQLHAASSASGHMQDRIWVARLTSTPANPLKTGYPAKCRCTLKKPPVKPMVFSNSIEQQKLFCLVSHHSKAFLPLVRCNLMLFSFSSARHRRTPLSLAAAKASVDVITRLLCRFGNVWSSRKRRPGKDCVTLTKDYSGVRRHRSSSSRPYR